MFSKNLEEHLLHLQEVFEKLRNTGINVKPQKCQLLCKQVWYLGWSGVSGDGIATDPERKAAVQSWPTSTNVHELKQFLGLASYYRRFASNFSNISASLHWLTEKGRKWYWDEDCEMSFQNLKICLTTTPVLRFPNFNYTFLVDVDSSGGGIGVVLSQKIDGREEVIAYASRTLNK